jgi:putative DNA primase/helicase
MPRSRQVNAQALSDIPQRRTEWLVPGRVPIGSVTLLAGDPGRGKSLLTASWAAQLTRGEVAGGAGDAVFVSVEDSPSATLRPRLEAAGALVDRIWLPRDEDGDHSLWLPDDMDALRQLVLHRHARLVVIDPISAHLSVKVNSWQDQSVRTALAPLSQLADELQCAVIAVAHLRKSQGGQAIHRIGGSIGFTGLARSVLLLANDPADSDRRVLAHIICNIAQSAPSLAYVIESVTQLSAESEPMDVPRLRFDGESRLTADDLLGPAHDSGPVTEAADFLSGALACGPLPAKVIRADARKAGIALRTLDRAKSVLSVKSERRGGLGGEGGWWWSLTSAVQPGKDANSSAEPAKDANHSAASASKAEASQLSAPKRRDGVLSGEPDGESEQARLSAKWPDSADDFGRSE